MQDYQELMCYKILQPAVSLFTGVTISKKIVIWYWTRSVEDLKFKMKKGNCSIEETAARGRYK